MNNVIFATTTTTAAIAAQRAAQQREEEEMTPYSASELNEDWEFKILRSQWGSFGTREKLQELLAEEARAGWTLVEVFDPHRIRLKRPASVRAADGQLDFNAYRTHLREPMPEHWEKFWRRVGRILVVVAVGSIGLAAAMWLLSLVLPWLR